MIVKGVVGALLFASAIVSQTMGEEKPKQEQKIDVTTDLSLQDLLNSKITVASKTEEEISEAPGIISIISHDEIQRTGATSFKELLLRIPSLGIASNGASSRSIVVMRGDLTKINSSHILFLINGRPIREIQENGVNCDIIESFPVNMVQQIEIIRGPGSVLYGSDAFAGVINIKTKNSPAEPFKASVTGHYEPAAGGGGSGDVLWNMGDLNVTAGLRYYEKPPQTNDYHSLTMVMQDTLIHPVNHEQGTGAIVTASYKGLLAMGSFLEWLNTEYMALTDVTYRKYFGNLGYKADICKPWKTEINGTITRSEWVPAPKTLWERQCYNILLENTHFFSLLKQLNIIAGGTVSYIQGYEKNFMPGLPGTSIGQIYSEGNRWAYSGYGQVEYAPIEQIKLFGGLQANKTKVMPIHFAPRLGAIGHPIKEISIKAFYSEAFRLPSINELFIHTTIGMYGDSLLKPEIIKTTDISVSYQNEAFMVGLTYFHSILEQMIEEPLLPGSFYERRYANGGTHVFNGGEFEGKWYATKELYLNGSMLYQICNDSVYDSTVPYPHLGFKMGVSYVFPQGITLSLSETYQGDVPEKFKGNYNKSSDHVDNGPFNLLNFSSQCNLAKLFDMKSRLEPTLLFKVDNLLGKEIWLFQLGGFNNDVNPVLRGREFFVGFNLSL